MDIVKVPVSIGELMDKMTILSIKTRNISDPGKLQNIRKELDFLTETCVKNDLDFKHSLVTELESVNEKLWKTEDDIREKERSKEFDEVFIELARSVYRVNDERFSVKSKINQTFGSVLAEEKSYEDYS